MNEVAGSVELHKSSVLALLIRGDRSEFTPMEDLDLFTSFYERSEIVTITNASHWVFVDRPAVFMKEIANYLERYSDL
jgi:pimeloyl-ACP methyl ester carboxylesterase